MVHILVLLLLLLLELAYFRIANKYNIIDKPNLRSSHSNITLRGGGIIFYFAAMLYFGFSNFAFPWFFLGLSLMTIISFLDDIFTLSNKLRLTIHFSSVLLMAYQLDVFSLPWYFLLITFIVVVGVLNAYNFMDGINGITAFYSLSVIILLLLTNKTFSFIDPNFLIFPAIGLLVFGFFNFRIIAKCFAGDVGSVSIAFIILFALGMLIIKTENFIYFLFLIVYGVDTVWTILRRLYLKENIFKAHRTHLYQYLVNEAGYNKLTVSTFYAVLQFIVGILVIWAANFDFNIQLIFSLTLILVLSILYLGIKQRILRKYVNP
ncbi:UDP-GlcNAc--UDP-phosphate GlcNAc-1-phosphate transferase [Sphingobacterium mizutaii]|uniref:UDP-GlcNAc--UDP-phosphate GlcNAc-1-phosphate transferase n=1 Tax=Sphingobacterium mizutaii TaxID=1010 RepID=UPI001626C1F1|nr:UDP-GlcNAc--UDP-phosphate GlcNAc-1-phosphate transferase [Sphingobacterium mizutaii]